MFKVYNKDAIDVLKFLLLALNIYFTRFCSASIVDFDQVNV